MHEMKESEGESSAAPLWYLQLTHPLSPYSCGFLNYGLLRVDFERILLEKRRPRRKKLGFPMLLQAQRDAKAHAIKVNRERKPGSRNTMQADAILRCSVDVIIGESPEDPLDEDDLFPTAAFSRKAKDAPRQISSMNENLEDPQQKLRNPERTEGSSGAERQIQSASTSQTLLGYSRTSIRMVTQPENRPGGNSLLRYEGKRNTMPKRPLAPYRFKARDLIEDIALESGYKVSFRRLKERQSSSILLSSEPFKQEMRPSQSLPTLALTEYLLLDITGVLSIPSTRYQNWLIIIGRLSNADPYRGMQYTNSGDLPLKSINTGNNFSVRREAECS
ncbi:hypothetical protein Tco_0844046 [Tanacetum coccineum]